MARTYKHLSSEEREAIMDMRLSGASFRAIGRTLERAPSKNRIVSNYLAFSMRGSFEFV